MELTTKMVYACEECKYSLSYEYNVHKHILAEIHHSTVIKKTNNYQLIKIECGFTLKRVRDMTRTYSTIS